MDYFEDQSLSDDMDEDYVQDNEESVSSKSSSKSGDEMETDTEAKKIEKIKIKKTLQTNEKNSDAYCFVTEDNVPSISNKIG